jgi:hypothetical protein
VQPKLLFKEIPSALQTAFVEVNIGVSFLLQNRYGLFQRGVVQQ